jgi:[ribosomal protein S5]-alanine N-acetyltransferase
VSEQPGPIARPQPTAPAEVHTDRMVLRRPVADDLDELAALLGDARVGRWLGGVADRARTAEMLERWIAHWDAHRFGLWSARDRDSGALVGRGGLSVLLVDGGADIEAGWTIAADRWGEGLATELGAAAIEVAEQDLRVERLVSLTLHDNLASRRVMQKLGFSHARDVTHAGLPHVLYRRPPATLRP